MAAICPTLVYDTPRRAQPLPVRGVVVAAIAVGLGACLIRPTNGSTPWAEFGVLATMALASILGAKEARRMVLEREPEFVRAASSAWMTVVIGSQGPADTAGELVEPKAPPRNDPERRALARRARERRTEAVSRR
jgi:hypothetical protein